MPKETEPLHKPEVSARVVGLRYVTDSMPGIRRERCGKGFRFRYPTGDVIQEDEVLRRIRSLAIPPAWQEVWICPDPCGHLQATGRDARGRKQSRYHPRWREIRDETKYARMVDFARALPIIRKRVESDLNLPGLPRRKVLATVVRLLEVSLIRVGNAEYARQNGSFGLTTMRDHHVKVNSDNVAFRFQGKGGKWHEINIRDPGLAKVVKRCQDVPGQELFQYYDREGKREIIGSEDVNEYLREISGKDFTAKDFRTWAGTVLAALALSEFRRFDSAAQAKKNVLQAIETVSQRLGNTVAVCRKCYVHPEVIGAYLDGTLLKMLKRRAERQLAEDLKSLRPEEAAVLAFLQQRLARVEREQKSFAS
ncbi:MAG TPA: DNA topoisomerase IB [Clostridia bacterium]|nr:DNA topoisomerase IB [Clostridia bacterium]